MSGDASFGRFRLLVGEEAFRLLQSTRVIIFGVGGVGSWCAEALVRSGIGDLTMVDEDSICRSNINRQVQATAATVGRVKVTELERRLKEINPHASIRGVKEKYSRLDREKFNLASYQYVIDAIDSLSSKVDLIMEATAAGATVFTALGASGKLDPTRIRVAPLWESRGCPLGKLVRKRLRRRKFKGNPICVYSEEVMPGCAERSPGMIVDALHEIEGEEPVADPDRCAGNKRINGSAVHVTGTFGFFLACLVIQDVIRKCTVKR